MGREIPIGPDQLGFIKDKSSETEGQQEQEAKATQSMLMRRLKQLPLALAFGGILAGSIYIEMTKSDIDNLSAEDAAIQKARLDKEKNNRNHKLPIERKFRDNAHEALRQDPEKNPVEGLEEIQKVIDRVGFAELPYLQTNSFKETSDGKVTFSFLGQHGEKNFAGEVELPFETVDGLRLGEPTSPAYSFGREKPFGSYEDDKAIIFPIVDSNTNKTVSVEIRVGDEGRIESRVLAS